MFFILYLLMAYLKYVVSKVGHDLLLYQSQKYIVRAKTFQYRFK